MKFKCIRTASYLCKFQKKWKKWKKWGMSPHMPNYLILKTNHKLCRWRQRQTWHNVMWNKLLMYQLKLLFEFLNLQNHYCIGQTNHKERMVILKISHGRENRTRLEYPFHFNLCVTLLLAQRVSQVGDVKNIIQVTFKCTL